MTETIRLSLDMSPALHQTLQNLAWQRGCSMAEVLRLGIALYEVAATAKKKGQSLVLVPEGADSPIITRIVGL